MYFWHEIFVTIARFEFVDSMYNIVESREVYMVWCAPD